MKSLKRIRKTNTKPKTAKNREQKVSRENPPPKLLARLLDLVSYLETDDVRKLILEERLRWNPHAPGSTLPVQAVVEFLTGGRWGKPLELIFPLLDKLPRPVAEFVCSHQSDEFFPTAGPQPGPRYFFLAEAQNVLHEIVTTGKLQDCSLQAQLIVNEQGKIALEVPLLKRALEYEDGTDIEVSRIRRCPICTRFFWANHSNKQRCSDQCTNVLKSRRYRERYPELYKLRRNGVEVTETPSQSTKTAKKGT
jgi:hypothetical protein